MYKWGMANLPDGLLRALDATGRLRDSLEDRFDRQGPQPAGVFPRPLPSVLGRLDEHLGTEVLGLLEDPRLQELEEELAERRRSRSDAPFPPEFNASDGLARATWALVRCLGAARVVETGVAAGHTTAYILDALDANGAGHLDSIDVPPADVDPQDVGWLVPERLRGRWTLHRRRSRRVLPGLLRREPTDVFLHDGFHTARTMRWELEQAGRLLRPGGAVLCDDVERNGVFASWAASSADVWDVVETGFPGHWFGLALKR